MLYPTIDVKNSQDAPIITVIGAFIRKKGVKAGEYRLHTFLRHTSTSLVATIPLVAAYSRIG